MQQVDMQWRAWHGDRPLILTLPSAWKITVHGNRYKPVVDTAGIEQKIRNPIGSSPLHILSNKSKKAAIIIDDITRPTPTDILLPLVINELARGGMSHDAMVIFIGGGGHRKASQEEILKKLGPGMIDEFIVVAHDCEKNTHFCGTSSDGVPIHLNRSVLSCDLKIGIGSILPHPFAGFSGGSKILCPGVCGEDTIRYLHDYTNDYQHDYNAKVGWSGSLTNNRFRRSIDGIAGEIGLDFIVNAVLNGGREICGLFCGDRIDAFHQGEQMVRRLYGVERSGIADIVIANTYPFDNCLRYMLRGFWPFVGARPNATTVAIGAAPEGIGDHGLNLKGGSLGSRAWKRFKHTRPHLIYNDIKIGINILKKLANQKKQRHLFLCPGLSDDELTAVFPKSKRFDTWPALLKELEKTYKSKNATVAIYPYAPLQFPKSNGDVA